VAVTQSAQSLPEAPPDRAQPDRRLSSPAAFIGVVAVAALVIILCVLGTMASGLFGLVSKSDAGADADTVGSTAPQTPHVALTDFDDGQWLVGTDIVSGTYSTTVPAGSAGCDWERLSSTDGTASSVLESGVGKAGDKIAVDIKATDKVFQSSSCGRWRRTTG